MTTDTLEKESQVFGDKTALFILYKIADMGSTTLAFLDKNLVAPGGWIALAKVWRADFIDIIGDYVTITEAGKRMVAEVEAMIAAPTPCVCSDSCNGIRGSASCIVGTP